jgi:DNA-binding CsgD family transcriptional regulator
MRDGGPAHCLELVDGPCFTIDVSRRLLHANRAAKVLFTRGVIARDRRGRVKFRGPPLEQRLDAYLAGRAVAPFHARYGPGLLVQVRPAVADCISAADRGSYMVRIYDLHPGATVCAGLLCDLFGLTPAEARVVARVATGSRLAYIASELGVSIETVRTQAKQAMRKMDAHSQNQLVGILARFPRR